jgi:hypothetical protein
LTSKVAKRTQGWGEERSYTWVQQAPLPQDWVLIAILEGAWGQKKARVSDYAGLNPSLGGRRRHWGYCYKTDIGTAVGLFNGPDKNFFLRVSSLLHRSISTLELYSQFLNRISVIIFPYNN